MIGILFNGLKFGIVLAFLIGPVFFTIIQASIERGFWVGVLVALVAAFFKGIRISAFKWLALNLIPIPLLVVFFKAVSIK